MSNQHPKWRDGSPVLLDQHVMTPDGWAGFIVMIHAEEITVSSYSPDEWEQEFSPADLLYVGDTDA